MNCLFSFFSRTIIYIIYIIYIISYHIISYHIISYHIISYHIISYHIISYISYYCKKKYCFRKFALTASIKIKSVAGKCTFWRKASYLIALQIKMNLLSSTHNIKTDNIRYFTFTAKYIRVIIKRLPIWITPTYGQDNGFSLSIS